MDDEVVEPLTVRSGMETREFMLVTSPKSVEDEEGSNSFINGNDFILGLATPLTVETAGAPGSELPEAAGPTTGGVVGDSVMGIMGELPEMNWLKPDKSSECVRWWFCRLFIWPSGGVVGSTIDWTELIESCG